MSIQSASEVTSQYGEQCQTQQKKASVSVFTDPRAQMAQGVQNPSAPSGKQTNSANNKQEHINKLLKNYRLTEEQFYTILQKGLNINKEKLFSGNDNIFRQIIQLVEASLEFDTDNYEGNLQDSQVDEIVSKLSQKVSSDASYESIKEFTYYSEGKELLAIIERETGKKYSSIQDIPEKELEQIIKGLINKYLSKDNKSDLTTKAQFIMQLLSTVSKVNKDDYKKLYNAFVKAAPEVNNDMKLLMQIIENFKNDPKKFEQFLNNGELRDICCQNGLNPEKAIKVVKKIAQAFDKDGTFNLSKFYENFSDIDKMYNDYAQKVKEGTANEYENNYVKFIDIIKKDPSKLTDEEKQFYAEHIEDFKKIKEKLEGIKNSVAAYLAMIDPSRLKELNLDKKSLNDIFEKMFDLQRFDSSLKINKELIDKLTDGALSKFAEAHPDIASDNNSGVAAGESGGNNSGFGFALTTSEIYNNAYTNLAQMRMGLTDTEAPITCTLDNNYTGKQAVAKFFILEQAGRNQASFKESVEEIGLVQTLINVGKDFGNACSTAKSEMKSYMKSELKRRTEQIDFLNTCGGNSALNNFGVKHLHLYNDERAMKNLHASIGDKRIYENLREQTEGEKDKKDKKDIAV